MQRGTLLIIVGKQGKINDRGVAAVSYNVLIRTGVTLGVGASFDTQKLDQATHKVWDISLLPGFCPMQHTNGYV